jgi:hypothetical protein
LRFIFEYNFNEKKYGQTNLDIKQAKGNVFSARNDMFQTWAATRHKTWGETSQVSKLYMFENQDNSGGLIQTTPDLKLGNQHTNKSVSFISVPAWNKFLADFFLCARFG